jgi:hypothetical protein
MPYWLAVTLAEAALAGLGDGLPEARAIFEGLGAQPWLDRLEQATASV